MGTLQTELRKVIDEWTADEVGQDQQSQTKQESKMHISKTIFNYIKDHEGCTIKNVVDAMTALGIKDKTTDSLIYQMMGCSMIVRDETCGELFVRVKEYQSIKSMYKKKDVNRVKRKYTKQQKPIEPTPQTKPEPTRILPKTERPLWNVQTLIENLSLLQGRELYFALKLIFEESTK